MASSMLSSSRIAVVPVAGATNGAKAFCSVENKTSEVSRRSALTLLAGASAVLLKAEVASAAYGESANIFAPAKTSTDFIAYEGQGFKIDIPSKWNPSKEEEFAGCVLRYEDNFDAVNNLSVLILPAPKKSITEYGSPEGFLKENSYLLGQQSYEGFTASEGGFAKNAVATASVLDAASVDVSGKTYYKLSILTRTADGNEGGIHQLITATISGDKLYIEKIQAGDKRWFKGQKKFVEATDKSFVVA